MKILITGSSGLVGSSLVPSLEKAGHQVIRLVRKSAAEGNNEVSWDPDAGKLDAGSLQGVEAAIHLAGETIVGRWTNEKKNRIRDSRVRGTKLLAETLARLEPKPRVLISASAIGYYGNRGDEKLTEDSAPGNDFLADVCKAWEATTEPASDVGIRVALLRFGIILSPKGGALAKMLTPFKMGTGGVVGNGKQYMSWIAIDDVVRVIEEALTNEAFRGPINVVTALPVTNQEFTKTLGRVLSRPTVFPLPAFAARLAFGEMADALLLASQRVEPARLQQAGFRFQYPDLEPALRHVLSK